MSVTALTSHAEIGPCVACAAAASAHHSPSAAWRLSLLLNIGGSGGGSEGGVVGGSGGESGGGSGGGEAGGKAGTGGAGGCNGGSGGSEGVAQVTEAQSYGQVDGFWASKLVWILSLLQSLKAYAPSNMLCVAPPHAYAEWMPQWQRNPAARGRALGNHPNPSRSRRGPGGAPPCW